MDKSKSVVNYMHRNLYTPIFGLCKQTDEADPPLKLADTTDYPQGRQIDCEIKCDKFGDDCQAFTYDA